MGDEPYGALLPWIVFAAVDRRTGQGAAWAAFAAIVTALALLAMRRRAIAGSRNVLLLGVVGWMSALGLLALATGPHGWFQNNGRALASLGYAVVAFVSLAATPAADYYTRPLVRPRYWATRQFDRVNAQLTLFCAAAFALITLSFATGTWINTTPAFTVFFWVVPIAIVAVLAHFSRDCWDDFVEEVAETDLAEGGTWDLSLDWHTPHHDND